MGSTYRDFERVKAIDGFRRRPSPFIACTLAFSPQHPSPRSSSRDKEITGSEANRRGSMMIESTSIGVGDMSIPKVSPRLYRLVMYNGTDLLIVSASPPAHLLPWKMSTTVGARGDSEAAAGMNC